MCIKFFNLTGKKPTRIYIYIHTHIYGLYFKSISNINKGGGKGNHTVSLIGIINSHVYKIQREMY